MNLCASTIHYLMKQYNDLAGPGEGKDQGSDSEADVFPSWDDPPF